MNRDRRARRAVVLALGVLLGASAVLLAGLESPVSEGAAFIAAGADAPLGLDHLGRDVLTQLVVATPRSAHLPIAAAGVLLLLGTAAGVALGLAGPRARAGMLRLIEALLLVPPVVSALVVIAGLGTSGGALVVCVVTVGFAMVTRVVSSATHQIASTAHVEMAFGAGAGMVVVAVLEVLPRLADLLRAEAGVRMIQALQLTAAIQFLGFGGGTSWGGMVLDGLPGFNLNPWATLAPGLALAALTVAVVLALDLLPRRRS